MKILVTGGAGFIGSALVRHLISATDHSVVNVDKLTYAANLLSLQSVADHERYRFVQADICDSQAVSRVFRDHSPDLVIHLAAESHVDRSIDSPDDFVTTNVIGTLTLLEESLRFYDSLSGARRSQFRFHHVSTDEVFGDLSELDPPFDETTAYSPSSPYSASKAASDHLVRAWYRTYGLPVVLSNCSNNYGPCQFPEKLIPLMIINALRGKELPVYGDGCQIRDWLYVEDHVSALLKIATSGEAGRTYCVGGRAEKRNIDVVMSICDLLDERVAEQNKSVHTFHDLITPVPDRPGHDRRYAIDSSRLESELDWEPRETFATGLARTVDWYLDNQAWWQSIADGSYLNWRNRERRAAADA